MEECLRANLLEWMPVRAGVRPTKTQGLAGSLDLIIVLGNFHLPLQIPSTHLLHPPLCFRGTNTGAIPWRTAKDLLGHGVILPSPVVFFSLMQWNPQLYG